MLDQEADFCAPTSEPPRWNSSNSQLRPGNPATHFSIFLRLLPSGPDRVQKADVVQDPTLNTAYPSANQHRKILGWEFDPGRADSGLQGTASSPSSTYNHRPRSRAVYCLNGASRDRTGDLRIANATLSQLSYGPNTYRIGTKDNIKNRNRQAVFGCTRIKTFYQDPDWGVVRRRQPTLQPGAT